jgi:hypothetical protein
MFYNFLNTVSFQAKFTQYTASHTAFFADQTEKKVFSSNVIMAHTFSFLVSQAEHSARSLSKTLHSSHCHTSYCEAAAIYTLLIQSNEQRYQYSRFRDNLSESILTEYTRIGQHLPVTVY